MKKIIIFLCVFLIIISNIYGIQLGTSTPLQQSINAMPAIPVSLIGKNIKFDFGGDFWLND